MLRLPSAVAMLNYLCRLKELRIMYLNRFGLIPLTLVVVFATFMLEAIAGDSPAQRKADLVEIQQLTEQIKLQPKRAFLYASRGQCYVGLEEWDKALIDTSHAIELQPQNCSFYVARASIFEGLNKKDLEKADLEKALQLSPNDVDALTSLAVFSEHGKRDYSLAAKLLTQALKIQPKSTELYALRGEIYCNLGRYAEAIADCDTALKIEPGCKKAMITMEEIKAAQKKSSVR